MPTPKLFWPIKVGTSSLQHRVVLAPLTRVRSSRKGHVPTLPLMETSYGQRSSRPGKAGGLDNVPGIWNQDQIDAWKKITERVHMNGSFIYLQLWAFGRAETPKVMREDGYDLVAPSPIPMSRIRRVEVHCANGYLIDLFLQDLGNQRTDEYGGSVEARSKFPLQVIDAIVKAIGEERTGLRISPFSTFQGMKMKDPVPQFTHFIKSLVTAYPDMAYLHTVEPDNGVTTESSDFLPGSFTMQSAVERAEATGDLIAFGRWYISNPDLPTRIEKNIPLTPFNRKTFYTPAHVEGTEKGYIDYPFADSDIKAAEHSVQSNATFDF
ncbi:hypothetical protein CPB84DRAFT_1784626 [Gymnopilus junonius]|uniref:NADH:flavin oxidoreductase/NADH oxidase N-terminal domain-containing protein n=1 Tax=Gymnopilus junonius TaxID=109634 RepID=A0A9P5NJN6_GYMJU|nr:hypothetical protein CPB84DRAFT_1784626 [Gymnopilus junonius]